MGSPPPFAGLTKHAVHFSLVVLEVLGGCGSPERLPFRMGSPALDEVALRRSAQVTQRARMVLGDLVTEGRWWRRPLTDAVIGSIDPAR
jgi:hypothetical protein